MDTWHARLADAGLDSIVAPLTEVLRPLGPVAAQLLWVMQPTFGLFGYAQAVDALADLLDDPEAGRTRPKAG